MDPVRPAAAAAPAAARRAAGAPAPAAASPAVRRRERRHRPGAAARGPAALPAPAPRPEGVVYRPASSPPPSSTTRTPSAAIEQPRSVALLAPLVSDEGPTGTPPSRSGLTEAELEASPSPGARFAALPDAAAKARSYDAWERDLEECLFRTRRFEIFRSEAFGRGSRPGEGERDFRIRLGESARERRDEETEALRQKYGREGRPAPGADRPRRAGGSERRPQAQQQTWKTVVSVGGAVLGALFGRKRRCPPTGTGRRVASGRTVQEQQDVSRAEETVEGLKSQLADAQRGARGRRRSRRQTLPGAAAIAGSRRRAGGRLRPRAPTKADVEVRSDPRLGA